LQVVSGVLKALDDKNGEVQNLAVKWLETCWWFLSMYCFIFSFVCSLGPLIRRARDPSAETIVDKLCFNTMTHEKDQAQLRDISSMGGCPIKHFLDLPYSLMKNYYFIDMKNVHPKVLVFNF
jgi:hypothetical protein